MLCPDCRAVLQAGATECVCGWSAAQAYRGEHAEGHQCAWHNGTQRCPAPATVSKRMHGERFWYCRWHAEHLDDPAMCAQILEDMLSRGVPQIVDWRDQLIDQEMHRLGLMRRPEESLQAYRKRCREMRQQARELARRFMQNTQGGSAGRASERPAPSQQEAVLELYEERRAILEADGLTPDEAHRLALLAVAGVQAA